MMVVISPSPMKDVAMPKNIVILLDGTSNQISADRTNILRLYGTLEKSEAQLVYYDPGVGTLGAEQAWLGFWRKTVEVWGMVTGYGMDQNVKEAYRFLVENFEAGPDGQDQIYIFGFSRGAYSARVLAGFLHAFGLMEKRNLNLLDYAYRAYKRIGSKVAGAGSENAWGEINLFSKTLRPYHPSVRLLGLFDTVSSVIESGRYGPRLRGHAFTNNNTSVQSVRQALAIHEKRIMFRPCLWPPGQAFKRNKFSNAAGAPQDTREVWFTGVHADVGGGYPEAESGLAKEALRWMIEQTRPTGLKFITSTVNQLVLGTSQGGNRKQYTKPSAFGQKQVSMNPAWAVLEFLPAFRPKASKRKRFFGFTLPLFELRHIPRAALIHHSVFERAAAYRDLPANLPPDYKIEP